MLLDKLCRADRHLSHVPIYSKQTNRRGSPIFSHLVPWEAVLSHVATSKTAGLRYDVRSGVLGKEILTEERTWEISKQWGTISCSQKSTDGAIAAKHAIAFTRRIYDIAMSPKPSTSDSENLIIALALCGQDLRQFCIFCLRKGERRSVVNK